MTLLPESLEDLIAREGLPRVAVKMLFALQNVHQELGVIHKDIKPDNFRIHEGKVKLIDFGLVLSYKDASGNHIEERNFPFTGTPHYASICTHKDRNQSRKDDLE